MATKLNLLRNMVAAMKSSKGFDKVYKKVPKVYLLSLKDINDVEFTVYAGLNLFVVVLSIFQKE